MLHVGLTGGMASGKSTVALLFAELGALVVDADALAREALAPGAPAVAEVVEAFGDHLLAPDGSLDRAALARVVFDDDAALSTLNAIVHPRVRAATAERVGRLPDDAVVVHDVPLLVENAMAPDYHLVVVVGASQEVRVERAVARGSTISDALARMATQADDTARRRAADVWVDNSGPEAELRSVVELLWRARVVPFRDNLVTGTAAEPGEAVPPAAAARSAWPEQAERLAARIDRAARATLSTVRFVAPPEEPVLDVVELQARRAGTELVDLRPAGFVEVDGRTWANADPGRPAVLHLLD